MSSRIRLQRICQYCGNEFTAQTTVTQYCSRKCASRAYKARKRVEKIEGSNRETQKTISKPIEELKAKEFLTVRDVAALLSCSLRTAYRLINSGTLKATNLAERITRVKRSELDKLIEQPMPVKPKKEPQPVTEFYTVKEIEEKYSIKYQRLNTIIKEKNIPKVLRSGTLYVSKPHIDRYFKRTRKDVSDISEWYTVQEIQEKYGLTRDQIYNKTHDNNIPKQRIGKYVKLSKKHFDELFENVILNTQANGNKS